MAEATTAKARSEAPTPLKAPRNFINWLRRWPVIPLIILSLLILAAVFAPILAPHSERSGRLRDSHIPPIWQEGGTTQYILGTDHTGRDILSRIIYGARISLIFAGVALVTGLVLGTGLGLVAGYFGRHIDELVMRIVDVWLALPFLLIALVVNVTIGSGFLILVALLALLAWSGFVRNIRAEVLSIKTRDYVALARVAGANDLRIMWRHILPQVTNTVMVIATLQVGGLILAEASLSFLGAGMQSPTPAWGLMVAEGRGHLSTHWWPATLPGIAIFLVVMSLNFTGDWLRDRFDPRLRQL